MLPRMTNGQLPGWAPFPLLPRRIGRDSDRFAITTVTISPPSPSPSISPMLRLCWRCGVCELGALTRALLGFGFDGDDDGELNTNPPTPLRIPRSRVSHGTVFLLHGSLARRRLARETSHWRLEPPSARQHQENTGVAKTAKDQ